jgi:hypothetical protein
LGFPFVDALKDHDIFELQNVISPTAIVKKTVYKQQATNTQKQTIPA